MKLLWQQLIAIVLLIGAALALSAFLLSRYMTTQIYDQRQKVLVQYGLNIVENHFTRSDLERMSQLLKDEEIVIQVYLEDGTVIYPSYDQRNSLQLSQEQLSRITAGETIGIQRSTRYDSTGKPTNMATVYVSNEGGYREFPQGFISIGAPLSDLDAQVQAIRDNIFLAFVIAGSMGIFFAILYAFYQTRRIKRLQMASRQIASGHYEMTLPAKGKDELSDLARDFQVMADALQESEAEIQRQETLRRQMMMDAAHEMRTPLTTMNGVLEGLYYDMIPENQKNRSLELVMKETQRLTRLVNENLDYEKIRSGQIVLKRQWVQPLTVFAQIQAQLEDKAKAKGDWIEYHADPHLQVWADEDRLVQVVMNITNNAIQFTDQGAIRLSASALDQGVEIKIEDQGIGIEADKVKNIWERFYKADISRKNNEFGESGIGLAVVKSLVEAHHGHVSVASKLGEGTSFTLFFPNPQP